MSRARVTREAPSATTTRSPRTRLPRGSIPVDRPTSNGENRSSSPPEEPPFVAPRCRHQRADGSYKERCDCGLPFYSRFRQVEVPFVSRAPWVRGEGRDLPFPARRGDDRALVRRFDRSRGRPRGFGRSRQVTEEVLLIRAAFAAANRREGSSADVDQ